MYFDKKLEKAYLGSFDSLMLCKDALNEYYDALKEIYLDDDLEYNESEREIINECLNHILSSISYVNRSVYYLLQNCI